MRRALLPGPVSLLSIALLLAGALSRNESFDLMFSVASGRWILNHGFPSADPFSFTADHPWFLQAWLYCALVAWLVDWFGGQGPAILMGMLLAGFTLATAHILATAGARRALAPLAAILLVLGCQDYALGAERSYHLGNLLFAGLVWLVIHQDRQGGRSSLGAIPLLVLWSNAHGSWFAGLALLTAFAFGGLLDGRERWRSSATLALVAMACLLAASVNPEGWQTLLFPLRLVMGAKGHHIAEWHAWSPASGAGLALAGLALACLVTVVHVRLRLWRYLLPGLGLLASALVIERFSVLAGLWLAATIFAHRRARAELTAQERSTGHAAAERAAPNLVPLRRAWERLDGWLCSWRGRSGSLLWPLLISAALLGWAGLRPAPLADTLDRRFFPVRQIEALCDLPPGRVLNTYRFGGAISALCGPEYKVFIDGREEPFPQRVHDDYRKLALLEPGWQAVLDEADPDYLLWSRLGHGSGLSVWLARSQRFAPQLLGRVGELWIRAAPAAAAPAPIDQGSQGP